MCDDHLLDEAIRLAYENVAQGGLPFGALVMCGERILGEGVDRTRQDVDPTAHAELLAIRAACTRQHALRLEGCLLVSSAEPCSLCQAAALLAGIPRCIYASGREAAADVGFDVAALAQELSLPLEQRRLFVLEHRPVPFARAPFDAWRMHGAHGPR